MIDVYFGIVYIRTMKSKFPERLRQYRGNRSQAEIAEQMDLSAPFYSDIERGKKKPSYETLLKIIEHTGLDANYWFGIVSTFNSFTDIKQEDIGTILSLLHSLSNNNCITQNQREETVNKNTTIAQLIVIIAQIRAYLSELDPAMLPESDRRTISDLLAACQRAMDSNEHPGPREGKNLKIIND